MATCGFQSLYRGTRQSTGRSQWGDRDSAVPDARRGEVHYLRKPETEGLRIVGERRPKVALTHRLAEPIRALVRDASCEIEVVIPVDGDARLGNEDGAHLRVNQAAAGP